MKKQEFNLSKRWLMKVEGEELFAKREIKEFIKRVKEAFSDIKINPHKAYAEPYQIFDLCIATINKLAGKKFA